MALNNVHGDFAYYDNMLRLTDLHFAQLGGTYDGNLLYNTKSSLLRGQATVVNGDIAGLLKVAALPGTGYCRQAEWPGRHQRHR